MFGYNGLKQLREQRDATVERWSKLGLLDGLVGNVKDNIALLYESKTSYIINEKDDIPLRD